MLELHPASDAINQLHLGTRLQKMVYPYRKIALCSHTRIHVISLPTLAEGPGAQRPCVSQASDQWRTAVKLPRRCFLRLAAGAAALPVMPRVPCAQAYPTRPVRIIVGFPAGGAADIAARLVGQYLSDRLGQPFVIENRPGAGGNIGTEAVVRAPSDGYTLLVVNPPNVINATLYERLNFSFLRDIAPVGSIDRQPYVLEVNASVPVKTVPDLIAYARANPGKLNMASSSIGSGSHVTGELFKMMAGIDMIHVPYRGGAPALTDLIGGQVQVMFDLISASISLILARATAPAIGRSWWDAPQLPSSGSLPPRPATSWAKNERPSSLLLVNRTRRIPQLRLGIKQRSPMW
jgi:hypothetical protein